MDLRFANRGAFFDTLRLPPRGNRQPRDPQGTIRKPRGHLQLSKKNGNPYKIITVDREVFGQTSTRKWVPGTIEFIRAEGIPLYPHHKIMSSQKYVFRDPQIGQKRSPGQNVDLGGSKSDPGPQNPLRGIKKQKMRAEKPCRMLPSEFLTEPYSVSYG